MDQNVSFLLIISTNTSSSEQNPYSLLSLQPGLNDWNLHTTTFETNLNSFWNVPQNLKRNNHTVTKMKIRGKCIMEMQHAVEAFSTLLLIPLLSGAFGILMFPYLTSQMWWSRVWNLTLHNSFGLDEIPSFIVKAVMEVAVYMYTAVRRWWKIVRYITVSHHSHVCKSSHEHNYTVCCRYACNLLPYQS